MNQSEFLERILDESLEIVISYTDSGRILFANRIADKLLEYPQGLQGEDITSVFPTVFVVENKLVSCTFPNGNEVHSVEAYRGNRTCFPVELKIIEDQLTLGMHLCFAMDASKQNYYEKQATAASVQVESAEQIKTQFVANVTHELRTPVNGILGNAQELSALEEDPKKKRYLNLIQRGCQDMHSIINNILDFSKLEAGKVELERRAFCFRDFMEYVKSNHINKINEKGLQFFMTVSPDVPEKVIGDELRIGQVLNNLLSNATKFTSVGRITVEVVMTAQIDKRVELFFMVIDTGIGIAKENQDKLFKSFSQVEASTTRKYGGTGLGLNISKQLVELMGGSIRVESELNRGTMFSFQIWLDVPEDVVITLVEEYAYMSTAALASLEDESLMWEYGSAENKEEMSRKLNKLILCVEMENWEKAEMFMESVRQLTAGAPQEIRSLVLRLKMAVQKADYDKIITAYENLQEGLKVND